MFKHSVNTGILTQVPQVFLQSAVKSIRQALFTDLDHQEAARNVFLLVSFFTEPKKETGRASDHGHQDWQTLLVQALRRAHAEDLLPATLHLMESHDLNHGVPLQCFLNGVPLEAARKIPHLWMDTAAFFESVGLVKLTQDSGPKSVRTSPVFDRIRSMAWQNRTKPKTAATYKQESNASCLVLGFENCGQLWEVLWTMKQVWSEQPPGTWLFHVLQLSDLDWDDEGEKKTADKVIQRLNEVFGLLQMAVDRFPHLHHCLLAVSVNSVLAQNDHLLKNFPMPENRYPDVSVLLAVSLSVSSDTNVLPSLAFHQGADLLQKVPCVRLVQKPEQEFVASVFYKQLALTLNSWVPRAVLQQSAEELAKSLSRGFSNVQKWNSIVRKLPQVCMRLLGTTDQELKHLHQKLEGDTPAANGMSPKEALDSVRVHVMAIRESLALRSCDARSKLVNEILMDFVDKLNDYSHQRMTNPLIWTQTTADAKVDQIWDSMQRLIVERIQMEMNTI
mmetsp:Transcript_4611/g.7286  ORF Transcript_4611/g.7286 Transcript_4611/m.7286 type:complete len:504 (+) Transcript_4611:160-1671(+)